VAGQPFANPLAVAVTAKNSIEPVVGGVVNFAATPSAGGASATLSAMTATIQPGQSGQSAQAAVTATANNTPGGYSVSATAAGASAASFSLTNTQALGSPGPIPGPSPSPDPGPTTTADVLHNVHDLAGLRAAIAYANSHTGPDTITFDPAVFAARPRTIRLFGGPLVLTDSATTTIVGPGAKRLTISGAGRSRVFDVEGGSLVLKGMTIRGGRAARGGGILNHGGTLVLDRVALRGNRARVGGGLFNDGTATLMHVVIRGNRARAGSGLFSTREATFKRRGPSSRAATGPILSDDFNGTGGVPKDWAQSLGAW
jgi:hypothetical protein